MTEFELERALIWGRSQLPLRGHPQFGRLLADELDRLNAQALELCAEISGLRRELAAAEALLRETKRDLRIAAKCMNPLTPVFRQFNDTADRIDAFLAAAKKGER